MKSTNRITTTPQIQWTPPTSEELASLQELADDYATGQRVVFEPPIDDADLRWGYWLAEAKEEDGDPIPPAWLGFTQYQSRRALNLHYRPYEQG